MRNVEKDRGNFKTRAPWFKFFPTDWREGTRHLSAEVRGIYADCLALMYEIDAPLPADDKWMAHQLHISVRAWRNALSVLARDGKLFPLQDGWSNLRADEERLKRRSIADQNRIIAQSREDQKREKSKNGNENNETAPRTVPREEHHVRARQTSEFRESESDRSHSPASVEQDAGGVLAGLNGSASPMIQDIIGWMHNGDERSARSWLQTQITTFGVTATKESWAKLKTEIAEGGVFAHPLRAWSGIARTRKSDAEKATATGKKSALAIIADMEAAGEF
jgi:uncharacterized protein YdaU (DUF1376 family)